MDSTLFEKVRDIVAKQTGIPSESILPSTALPADFVDRVMIGLDIEEEFGISINLVVPEELVTRGIVKKLETISDVLNYLETKIKNREEEARRAALKGRVDEFSQKLKNGEIKITDIPPEIFFDVLPSFMDTLSAPVLSKIVNVLEDDIAIKKQILEQKKSELQDRKELIRKFEAPDENT